MTTQTLFDPVPSPAATTDSSRTESRYSYLNRAEGPVWQRVRELLERWYSEYPDGDGDLRSRFRKAEDDQHVPAWWELYTYILFRRLGYAVDVHPPIPGRTRRPDFLVSNGDSRMFVECVVHFDNVPEWASDTRKWLLDCIDAARSPDYFVSVKLHTIGDRRPKKGAVIKQVETWLNSLEYDEVYEAITLHASPTPSHEFELAGSVVELSALPKNPDRRGSGGPLIGMGPAYSAFPVSNALAIRKLLQKKSDQCKGADAPVVVAVFNWSTFATQREVGQALFGGEQISFSLEHPESEPAVSRDADGYWHPGPPARGARISGVLFGEGLYAGRTASALPTLWRNPWADMPMTDSLPFETLSAENTGQIVQLRSGTDAARNLFGLPESWPSSDETLAV